MKLIKPLLFSTVFAVSTLFSTNLNVEKNVTKVDAFNDGVVDYNYIAMNDTNFHVTSGNLTMPVFKKSETYWNEKVPYGAIDDFLGWNNESLTGTITSVRWTQHCDSTRFVSFTLGGNSANKVIVHYGDKTKEYSTGDIGNVGWLMAPRVFEVPSDVTGDVEMYIELVDNSEKDYGSVIFGGLQVNQTAEDVKQMIELWKLGRKTKINPNFYDNMSGQGYDNIVAKISELDEYKNVRDVSITKNSFNEGFEGSDWLLNWTLDYSTDYTSSFADADTAKAVNRCDGYNWSNAVATSPTHSDTNMNMPFNQTGSAYFHGFYENDRGFIAGDNYTYRIVSKAFVLNSDLISVKLSGNGAKFQIVDASSLEVLGTIENTAFNSEGDQHNIALSGCNTVTMTRYIANVHDLKGRTVRLAMVDSSDGGWGAINVDEIKTDYNLNDFKFSVDTYHQSNATVADSYGQITDKYFVLSDANNELSYIQDAYNYLQNHYSILRSNAYGSNFCDVDYQKSDTVKNLLNQFNALSDEAAALVSKSSDYNHGASATSENWYLSETQTFEAWRTIDYLMNLNNITNNHTQSSLAFNAATIDNNQTITIIVVVSLVAISVILGMFFVAKRRKEE